MKKLLSIILSIIMSIAISVCFTGCDNSGDPPPKKQEVPVVKISTNGASIDSKVDYVDMTFSIEKTENTLTEVEGGIRLRGNTTMRLPKKPYRIKFDKKQSLFGLTAAKSWVLLAEYLDPSGLHNYTAFNIASQMPNLAFTPTPYKVDVYLNGEYQGLYTLCEQVQENKGRMDIELDEITADMTNLKDFNFFISMDQSVRGDIDAVLDETYFYLEEYDRYFELKYPEKDQFVSNEQFRSFFTQLKEYVSYIMKAFTDKNVAVMEEETNLDSLIDYMMVDQMMGEMDHMYKSFNMYYTNTSSENENGKLNFGPVWDYDSALFTTFTGEPNVDYTVKNDIYYSNVFFKAIEKTPALYTQLKTKYNTYGKTILENAISSVEAIVPVIQPSLKANHELWYKDYPLNMTDKNIEFLLAFLRNRLSVFKYVWSL